MKNLLFLVLLLSFSTQAQSLFDIFKGDEANRMTISWKCSADNYPDVNRLPEFEDIEIKVKNNGKIKISPDIFSNYNRPENKNSVSIDYSSCFDKFYADVKQKFDNNTINCSNKKSKICQLNQSQFIDLLKEKSSQFNKGLEISESKKLPLHLLINQNTQLDSKVFSQNMENFCKGKSVDENVILDGGFLSQSDSIVSVTENSPSLICLEKLKNKYTKYGERLQKNLCSISVDICDFIKNQIQNKSNFIDSMKAKRAIAIQKKDEFFRKQYLGNGDKEYEESFNNMLKTASGDNCQNFLGSLPNTDKSNYKRSSDLISLVSKNMDKLFEKMDSECQKKFIRQYAEFNTYESALGKNSIQNYCQLNNSAFCDEIKDLNKIIEKNLERMVGISYGAFGRNYFNDQKNSCSNNPDKSFSHLNNFLEKFSTISDKMLCASLEIGESKVVSGNSYPTGLSAKYSLNKRSPTITDAYLNINFQGTPDFPSAGKEMEEKAKKCISDVTPYMKGPDGQSLNIIIINPTEAKKLNSTLRPPANSVLVGKSPRENSGFYDTNSDCSTITHEVLHLFGLVDEYEEKWIGNYYDVKSGAIVSNEKGDIKPIAGKIAYVNEYNCRIVSKVNSMMKNPNEVFRKALPKNVACECVGNTCKDFMNSNSPKLQELYQNNGWDIIDGYNRNKYCKAQELPVISKEQYLKDPKQFKLLAFNEGKISINFKNASEENKIASYNLNCECNSQSEVSSKDEVENCKKTIALVANKIDQNLPIDSVTCSPDSILKEINSGEDLKIEGKNYRYFIKSKAEMNSLLWPSQFERIVGGACPEKAELFNRCSQFAYKTFSDKTKCNIPKECNNNTNKIWGIAK